MADSRRSGRVSGFFEETEIHGIRKAFNGGNVCRRAAWFTVFLVSTSAMCYFLYNAFLEYGSGRLTTQTTLVVSDEIPFPTVTFCSIDEYDIMAYNEKHIAIIWQLIDEFGITGIDSIIEVCHDDEAFHAAFNHPQMPKLIKTFMGMGGCEVFHEIPALKTLGSLYDQVKNAFLTLDTILETTLFPVDLAKQATEKVFGALESTYNTLANALPGPVPTTHDIKEVLGNSAGNLLNVVQDVSTNILKAPGTLFNGLSRLGKRRRKRRTLYSLISETTVRLHKRKSTEMNKLTKCSTNSTYGLQHWRRKRGLIGDEVKHIGDNIQLALDVASFFMNLTREFYQQALYVRKMFNQDEIIANCTWVDNEGTAMNCNTSIKPKLYVGFGKCLSVNEAIGEKRFKGNSLNSMIHVKLAQLPPNRAILHGFFELPSDFSYRIYLSSPGIVLPENEHQLIKIPPDDMHTFNIDNYNEVLMKSTTSMPCRVKDETGIEYNQDICIRDCFRLLIRKTLGCWLYDTERYLMERHTDSFRDSDSVLMQSKTLVEPGLMCDANATTAAIDMRPEIAKCSRTCPLSCRYESFDIEHVRSRRNIDYRFSNTSEIVNTEIIVRQKRTTMLRQEQTYAYTFFNLLAEIGGNMGLCIGASLLTICHLLEFVFVDVLAKGLCGIRPRVRSGHTVDEASKDSYTGREISRQLRKETDKKRAGDKIVGDSDGKEIPNISSPRMRPGSRQSLDTYSYDLGPFSPIPSPLPKPRNLY